MRMTSHPLWNYLNKLRKAVVEYVCCRWLGMHSYHLDHLQFLPTGGLHIWKCSRCGHLTATLKPLEEAHNDVQD